MKAIALTLMASLLIAGCGGGTTSSPTGSQGPSSPSPSPSDDADQRSIDIWSATIRELVTEDNTFGEGKVPFDHIYVLDHADANAAELGGKEGERTPISSDIQQGIKSELSDLPPLQFVSGDGDEVIVDEKECAHVRDNGALITLGAIPEHANSVEVQMGMFVACLAGTWLTYVVKHAAGDWVVKGTTGPVAIS